jgi:hypothetical protein
MPKRLIFFAYSYAELYEDTKQKALEYLHEINNNSDSWYEWMP